MQLGTRHRRPSTLIVALVAVVLLGALGGGSAAAQGSPHHRAVADPAPARSVPGQVDGLEIEGATTYDVRPLEGLVHVTVDVTLTNTIAPRRTGAGVETVFFRSFVMALLSEAENVAARTASGRDLSVRVDDEFDFVSLAEVELSPDLVHGSPQSIVVEYDLVGRPPRSAELTRASEGYVSFVVFALGDSLDASVTVRAPARFEASFDGSQPVPVEAGATIDYRFDVIQDPAAFFSVVTLRDDSLTINETVETGAKRIDIHGFSDDRAWVDFAVDTFRTGTPLLEEFIGFEWPGSSELRVLETVNPYLFGYAGWFLPFEDLIEVGDALDAEVMLHELSHLWFNNELFADRWISEGLAQTYANMALAHMGRTGTGPSEPDTNGPGAMPLREWQEPSVFDEDAAARELYGYTAAHHVVGTVLDEIGVDRMQDVLTAAANHWISYPTDAGAEIHRPSSAPGWQRFLDLLEDLGGSTTAEELFGEFVIGDDSVLEARRLARASYDDLVTLGAGWSPPHEIRALMTEWQFDQVDAAIDTAELALARRGPIADVLAQAGLGLPAGLERAFEQARDVDDLAELFDDYAAAAQDLVTLAARTRNPDDLLARIGLIGDDETDLLDRTVALYEAGDLERLDAAIVALNQHLDDASRTGALRIGAAALVALLLLGGTFVLRRRGRDRRDAAEIPEPDPALSATTVAGTGSAASVFDDAPAEPWFPVAEFEDEGEDGFVDTATDRDDAGLVPGLEPEPIDDFATGADPGASDAVAADDHWTTPEWPELEWTGTDDDGAAEWETPAGAADGPGSRGQHDDRDDEIDDWDDGTDEVDDWDEGQDDEPERPTSPRARPDVGFVIKLRAPLQRDDDRGLGGDDPSA